MFPLIDNHSRIHSYLRISVTDRCNFRCIYCMPPEGIAWRNHNEILTLEEILRVAGLCVDLGVRKIRLTGGEPLVRKGIDILISQLAKMPGLDTLAITTNGALLGGEMAKHLKSCGLDALNISLDTLRRERFEQVSRCDQFDDVLSGIDAALEVGYRPLKLNVVVMGGVNDDELLDFVALAADRPINVRFIEYMPFKGNRWSEAAYLPMSEMLERICTRYSLSQVSEGISPHASARDYSIDGFSGKVSFISPMSAAFCDRCSRLRLTADGSIKSCLFHAAEVNLRQALRCGSTDEEIEKLIRHALWQKPEAHPFVQELETDQNRCMCEIGG